MNINNFQKNVENKLGNYRKLPIYPFNKDVAYAIFPGAEEKFISENLYRALFTINLKFGNQTFLVKPHFTEVSDERLYLQQSVYDWKSFNDMQDNHLVCEGIYLSGNLLNWLGIYHYHDYLIVGGDSDFIRELCITVYGDVDWKARFIHSFDEGEISMYQSDYNLIIRNLF